MDAFVSTGDKSKTLEIYLAILLGLAATLTAFAAFKASLIGDDMVVNYNEGIRTTDIASQAYNEGNQQFIQDQALFLEYVKANQLGDTDLANYIYSTLMTPELQASVDWWEAEPDAISPFEEANTAYVLQGFEDGAALDEEAEAFFQAAQEADERSDRFELITVILAAALFFLGMASVVSQGIMLRAFVAIGSVTLAGSVAMLVMLLF